jgi:hypothetical protein
MRVAKPVSRDNMLKEISKISKPDPITHAPWGKSLGSRDGGLVFTLIFAED